MEIVLFINGNNITNLGNTRFIEIRENINSFSCIE